MFHRVGSDETYSSTSLALHSWRELPSCTHSYVPKPALDWVRPANNSLRIAVLRVSRNRGASFLSPRRKPSNTDHLLSNSHRETRLYYLIAQLLDGRQTFPYRIMEGLLVNRPQWQMRSSQEPTYGHSSAQSVFVDQTIGNAL